MPYLSMSAMMNEMRNTEADAARLLDLSLLQSGSGKEGENSELDEAPTKAGKGGGSNKQAGIMGSAMSMIG